MTADTAAGKLKAAGAQIDSAALIRRAITYDAGENRRPAEI